MVVLRVLTACAFILMPTYFAWALPESAPSVPGLKPGYLDSVEDEKTTRTEDLVVIREPPPMETSKPFVSDKLNKEFQAQYELRFGRTEAERNLLPNRYDTYFYNGLMVTYEEDLRRKKAFGDYVIRRVEEYHLDNSIRDNKTFRPAYEAKEKISKVNVKISDDFRVKANLSLTGYFADIIIENPWKVQSKSTFYVGSKELITSLKYPLTSKVDILTDYRVQSSVVRVILARTITPALSANISGTTFMTGSEGEGTVDGFIRQRLVLVGFTYRN